MISAECYFVRLCSYPRGWYVNTSQRDEIKEPNADCCLTNIWLIHASRGGRQVCDWGCVRKENTELLCSFGYLTVAGWQSYWTLWVTFKNTLFSALYERNSDTLIYQNHNQNHPQRVYSAVFQSTSLDRTCTLLSFVQCACRKHGSKSNSQWQTNQ